MPSQVSSALLRAAVALNVISFVGHTKLGFDELFPALKPLGPNNKNSFALKMGWLEVNFTFLTMAILCLKWANTGITDGYEKAVLNCIAVGQAYFGWRYMSMGMYAPMIALWATPGLAVASQFV
ncbi:hypothetical protein MMC24_002721 [Lignoscripta atroalba]|nr:hypothetical protein [Lignoscripta atroalba]